MTTNTPSQTITPSRARTGRALRERKAKKELKKQRIPKSNQKYQDRNVLVASNASSTTLEESSKTEDPIFHFFPELPPELRRKVWIHAAPKAILLASGSKLAHLPVEKEFAEHQERNFAQTAQSIPAVLHTCKESRDLFLATLPQNPPALKVQVQDGTRTQRPHPLFLLCSKSIQRERARLAVDDTPWIRNIYTSVESWKYDTCFISHSEDFDNPEIYHAQNIAMNTIMFANLNISGPVLRSFRELKPVTFVITARVKSMPEIDGEIDFRALTQDSVYLWYEFNKQRLELEEFMKNSRETSPENGWDGAVIKIRTLDHFLDDFV